MRLLLFVLVVAISAQLAAAVQKPETLSLSSSACLRLLWSSAAAGVLFEQTPRTSSSVAPYFVFMCSEYISMLMLVAGDGLVPKEAVYHQDEVTTEFRLPSWMLQRARREV